MDRIPSFHRRIKQLESSVLKPGTIVSFTTVRHPPKGFGSEPYTVALIEHPDGTKSLAQLTPESALPTIGAAVVPHMRNIRTMENGLRVNDLKYSVVARVPDPLLLMKTYVLALSGPSGVGKTTITRSLLSLFAPVSEQVPIYTTRSTRKTDSEPYVHVSEREFMSMIERGEIVSHTHMTSETELRHYGYRKKDIESIWESGKLPIVVTELRLLQGLVKALGRRAVLSCGVLPPGRSKRSMLSSLLHRLRTRGQNTEEQIEERLKVAEADMKAFSDHAHLFDHIVVNDELETCLQAIRELVVPGN